MLSGDNSILSRATQARTKTEIEDAREQLKLLLLEYEGNRYTTSNAGSLESFLTSKGATNVVDNEDGTLSLTYGGYNFIVDKSTYEVEQDNSLKPQIEVAVSEPDSNKNVTITVTISNASDFSKIDSIKLTNVNKNQVVEEKTDGVNTATFTVASNGDYKVEVKATKDGNQNKGTKVAQVTNIPVTFATNYGTIDVIWLKDNGKTISEKPNEPNLYTGENALKPVYWASSTDGNVSGTATTDVVEVKSTDSGYKAANWYNYSANRWANATNADGSYFVWIPRFAYRIIYWDSEAKNNVVGYYDGRGMVDVQGNVIKKTVNSEEVTMSLEQGVDTVTQDGIQYIVHPAFDDSVNNGGWKENKKLSGIWVAKYEMSREDYDANLTTENKWKPHGTSDYGGGNTEITTLNNTTIRAVSKPNVTSWRNIKIGFCYTNSYNYDRTKESHLMKNSEWGAVAYLTHSQYGRNGTEISVNQCKDYITGAGKGTGTGEIYNSSYNVDSTTKLPLVDQQYNGSIGQLSSSTGNISGIYDLSGGAYEYVASFDAASTNNNLTNYGWTELTSSKASTEYATAYTNGSSTYSGVLLYKVGKTGDATKEVYKGSGNYSWNSDYAFFVGSDFPFFVRGGYYDSTSNAGVFYSYAYSGIYYSYYSFRVVLAQ